MSVTIGTIPHIPDYTFGDIEFHVLNNTNTSLTLNTTKSIFGFAVSGNTGTNLLGYGAGSFTGTNLGNNQYSLSQTTDTVLYNGTRSILRSVTNFDTLSFDLQNRFSNLTNLNSLHNPSSTLILYMVPLKNTSTGFTNTNGVFVSSVTNITTVPIDQRNVTITNGISRLYDDGRPILTQFTFTSFPTTSGALVLRNPGSSDIFLARIQGSQITRLGTTTLTTRREATSFVSQISIFNSPLLDAQTQTVLFLSDNAASDVSLELPLEPIPSNSITPRITNFTLSSAGTNRRPVNGQFTFNHFSSTSGTLVARDLYYGNGVIDRPYHDLIIANVRGLIVTSSFTGTNISTTRNVNAFTTTINFVTNPLITATRQVILFNSDNRGTNIVSPIVNIPTSITFTNFRYPVEIYYAGDNVPIQSMYFDISSSVVLHGTIRVVVSRRSGSKSNFMTHDFQGGLKETSYPYYSDASEYQLSDAQINRSGNFNFQAINIFLDGSLPRLTERTPRIPTVYYYTYIVFIPANGDPHLRFIPDNTDPYVRFDPVIYFSFNRYARREYTPYSDDQVDLTRI